MRDPDRIDEFCGELARIWHGVPDWRFGQLMYNVFAAYTSRTGLDVFYLEDEKMLEFLKEYFNEV